MAKDRAPTEEPEMPAEEVQALLKIAERDQVLTEDPNQPIQPDVN